MKMLTQKLVLSYGSKILIQFVQIIASIIVARIAGPTVLGTVAFGLAFVSMFEFIADLGIGSAHVKLVSQGEDFGRCISTYSVLKFLNTFFFFIIVLGVFFVQKFVLATEFESTSHEYVIVIMLLSVTVIQLTYIPLRTFAARTEQAKQTIPEFIRIFTYQVLRVIIVLLGYRAVALAFGNLISALLVIPIILYLFKDYPRGKFDKHLAAKYLKISLPILVIGMSTNVIQYLDRVVLQFFTSSEQVGYYTAGYRIGSLILLIANSVGLLFFPVFSKAASNRDFLYIRNTINKFEKFSFLFIMPPVIFLSLYAPAIITFLLGSQYTPSIPIMIIINFAMFTVVMNTPYGNVVTGMGFFKLAAVLSLANLLLFVLLVYSLPNPRLFNLGAIGVAITVLVSNLFNGFVYRIFAKRKCPVINPTESIKYFVFGVVNFIVFYFLHYHLSTIYGASFKIFFVFAYFGITYLLLILLGWLTKEDLLNLRELVNIRKLGDYVKEEMKKS